MKKRSTLLLVFSLLPVPAAFAQQTFKVDPAASEVAFTLNGSDHRTHGTFHVENGSIDFDRSATKLSGSVVVAAGSGKTGNDSRDHKMTTEVLDAAHFSEVSFTPESYQGTIVPSGDSTIQVTGTLTLHGAAHEMTIPMQIHIEGTNCTAETHFTIPYVKWGLKDPSVFVFRVAKQVDIALTLVGHVSAPI
jgi:polyisoprenoid-binding protein YceI